MGIRAETQIALDALDVSKRDRLRTEDSLATALAMATTRRTKEARGGEWLLLGVHWCARVCTGVHGCAKFVF